MGFHHILFKLHPCRPVPLPVEKTVDIWTEAAYKWTQLCINVKPDDTEFMSCFTVSYLSKLGEKPDFMIDLEGSNFSAETQKDKTQHET